MRHTFLLISLITGLILATAQAMAASPMIVSGNSDGPPISWDKRGELLGVGPELATKILTELKVPFTIVNKGNWQQVQEMTRKGSIDMLVSAYDNAERRTYMDYSIPYLESPVVIVVKKDASFPFTSWKSLVGKKGVAHSGESFGQKFDTFIKSDLDVAYLPYERAFQMLAEDTADYLIIDLYPAIIYSKLLNAENKIDFLETPVTIQNFHFTLAKTSPYVKLLPEINKKIAALKKEKYIKKLAVDQYKHWHKTFKERQRFYAKQQARAAQEQTEYNAGARDRGLETLGRFIERDMPYMDGSNFN
jgi:polar amino acid transport system substrate-binding protein